MSAYFPLGGSNAVLGPAPAAGSVDPTNALNIAGNAAFTGNISAGNMGMFRNRVINGDMRVDQRNAGNAGNSGFGPDRFKVVGSNCATSVLPRRIELGADDVAATGGAFQYATSLSAIAGPTAGLTAYLGFNSNITDVMGGLVNPTVTGTVRYVSGVVGSAGSASALYLANEGNILATNTRAANMLVFPHVQSTALTVSCWVYATKLIQTLGQYSNPWSFGSSGGHGFSAFLTYGSSTHSLLLLQLPGAGSINTASVVVSSNTWYHVVATFAPSTSFSLYLNGALISTITTTVPSVFSYNSQLILGDNTASSANNPFAGYIDDFRIYNRALGSGEIALLAGLTTGISSAPSSGLAAYYPFDGSTAESSGNSGPALTTTGSVSYVTGAIGGQAVYLANEGNVLATSTKATNRLSGTYSVAGTSSATFWMRVTKVPQASGQSSVIFSFGTTTNEYWLVQAQYGSATVTNLIAAAGSSTVSTPITSGVWYFVTTVWSPLSTVSLYLNGTHISTVASGTATLTNGLLLLGDYNVTTLNRPFAGYIDDFRLYNRALTSAEIAYLAGNAPYPSIQTFNQAAHFPFDGALTDASGNGVTLTPTGSVQYVTGVTGTQAVYLANEANVTAGTAAANYITSTYTLSTIYTISFWFIYTRAPATNVSSALFATTNGATSPLNTVQISIYNNIPLVSVSGVGSGGTIQTASNTWNQCTITRNGSGFNIFINGNFSGFLSSANVAQNGFIIGNGGTAATGAFAGYIDDFRIYNTALTQSQIAALYYGSAHIANQATPYLGYVPSAAVLYQQSIEGNNVADLFYGTANAAPVAVSLWLKNATASAQSFTLALNNGGAGGASRSALYPIASVAPNTWRRVAVKVPGDLIGTWARDNGLGLNVALVLGANSNVLTATASAWQAGAYFTTETSQNYAASATGFLALQDNAVYVTGVQLEKGTLVTPFEFRPAAVELQLCQRYCYVLSNQNYLAATYIRLGFGIATSTTAADIRCNHTIPMRQIPQITTIGNFEISDTQTGFVVTGITIITICSSPDATMLRILTSGLTQYRPYFLETINSVGFIILNSEY